MDTIVLVGNPNVGKSVLFGRLTGRYVTVSNYPGTTVDISEGSGWFSGKKHRIVDTPGIHSLVPRSEDEQVARDEILTGNSKAVVQVADAKNLVRSLQLFLELSELKIPMVLALNMSDEARERGVEIELKRLRELLGVPVVETVGTTGEGFAELRKEIPNARVPRIEMGSMNGFSRTQSLLSFLQKARELAGEVTSLTGELQSSWIQKFGKLSLRPWPGYLIAVLVLWIMYEFVGVFAAKFLVDLLENGLFGKILNPAVSSLVRFFIPLKFVQDMLVGPYGIFSMALTYALALIFPIVSAFFLFFGILEDSGYLPRLAVMLDRMFRAMGLNGKAVLPMILGLGCGTMATLSTRVLDSKKEKLIVSLLLTLSVPCSAQLGAMLGMTAGLSWKVFALWFSVILGTMMTVGWLAARILPGSRSPFLMEIPPIRRPQMRNLLKKIRARLSWYVREAVPLFMLGTFLLFITDQLGFLGWIEKIGRPAVVNFLGLPAKATESFIIGFLRRDYGAAGFFMLAHNGLMNARQVTVALVVITLFMPCIAQFFVTVKERGLMISAALAVFVLGFSLAAGGVLNWMLCHFPLL